MTGLAQNRMPIVEAIAKYQGVRRIHMPGHKGGVGVAEPFLSLVGKGAFAADVVGVEGLDDYFSPSGCIGEAQELAAEAWGADHSFFLVNGTSCGIHAAILATCGPGEALIVPRNVHRSVVSGLILSGAKPVFVEPRVDEDFGVLLGLTAGDVEHALEDHPEARGVLLVSPTYYGVVSDVRAIAGVVHARGLPLLVDEAHGAYLGFHPALPPSALGQGADAVAQGVHKTAGSLSQGALLHLKGGRISPVRIRYCLGLVQTTSVSYLILGSLDAARHVLANHGEARLQEVLNFSRQILTEIQEMKAQGWPVRCFQLAGGPNLPFATDPLRVVINVAGSGLSGHEVERRLRREHGVQIELSDEGNIVLLLSLGDTADGIASFLEAFPQVIGGVRDSWVPGSGRSGTGGRKVPFPPVPQMVVAPSEAFRRGSRRVRLEEARNEVSAEMISAYPPGIPVIYPGEEISGPVLDFLLDARRSKVHLSGADDGSLAYIRVLK